MENSRKSGRIIAVTAVIVVFGLYAAGCATTVPIKSVRPPTIDTSNIQKLALRPFQNNSGIGGAVGAQLTQYLTDVSSQKIMNSGKFTIVAPSDPNADGIFTGEIRSIASKDSQQQRQKKDKDGNEITEITYMREVSLAFTYSVISTRTGMPVGNVSKQGTTSSSASDSSALTDVLTLAKGIVDTQLRQLTQDVVPTIVSTNRQLMKETSKDKVVKQRMKMAQALVKSGDYADAINEYDDIYNQYDSAAARVNANILRESVASDTAAQAKLAELFSDNSGLAGKAANGAVDTLHSRLPSGSIIIIMKTNSTERSMLDYTVDQITKSVVQAGKLKVVDRSNQTLIDAEQQYQLSGNVSDDSIVSIGHQLGAQYMALCWISGQMSGRRFNIRILNVETAQIAAQNDFEI